MANSFISNAFSRLSTEDAAEFISKTLQSSSQTWEIGSIFASSPTWKSRVAFLYCSENRLSTGIGL